MINPLSVICCLLINLNDVCEHALLKLRKAARGLGVISTNFPALVQDYYKKFILC